MLASILIALLAALLGVGAGVGAAALLKFPDWLCRIIELAVFGFFLLALPGML